MSCAIVFEYVLGVCSGIAYLIVRGVFALGLTLIFSGLGKELIEVKFKYNRGYVTAIGAVALFLLLYFFNPPNPPEYKTDSELKMESVLQNNFKEE